MTKKPKKMNRIDRLVAELFLGLPTEPINRPDNVLQVRPRAVIDLLRKEHRACVRVARTINKTKRRKLTYAELCGYLACQDDILTKLKERLA